MPIEAKRDTSVEPDEIIYNINIAVFREDLSEVLPDTGMLTQGSMFKRGKVTIAGRETLYLYREKSQSSRITEESVIKTRKP